MLLFYRNTQLFKVSMVDPCGEYDTGSFIPYTNNCGVFLSFVSRTKGPFLGDQIEHFKSPLALFLGFGVSAFSPTRVHSESNLICMKTKCIWLKFNSSPQDQGKPRPPRPGGPCLHMLHVWVARQEQDQVWGPHLLGALQPASTMPCLQVGCLGSVFFWHCG